MRTFVCLALGALFVGVWATDASAQHYRLELSEDPPIAVDLTLGGAGEAPAGCEGNGPNDEMVEVGPLCVDKFEASLWDSRTGGSSTDGSVCSIDGNDCTNIYARSVEGVLPAGNVSWFQAQQACKNAGKRLLTNAEWQMAAAGTPEDAASCNIDSGNSADTGSNATCASNDGVYDMVGNIREWVADWVPRSNGCDSWASLGSDDLQCMSGASSGEPSALVRGGSGGSGPNAGVFFISATPPPSAARATIGFRCAR